jgi:hypothetical protein
MTRIMICLAFLSFPPLLGAQSHVPDYKTWRAACAKLPANRELRGAFPEGKTLPLPRFADFEPALDAFLRIEREGPLGDARAWVDGAPDPKVFFDFANSWFGETKVPFQPFAAKLVLPNDAIAIIMGDLHGDVRSLLRVLDELNSRKILDGFRFRETKYHFLFLGDFTDRGAYGTEVLYTLFSLKAANPAQVHFARGNHEDFNLAARYGFLAELQAKYGAQAKITKVMRAYDLMPVVYYVGNGNDFLQMNHGGMEPGYDPRRLLAAAGSPRFQLLGNLLQKTYHTARGGWLGNDPRVLALAEEHLRDFTPEAPTLPRSIGFMWNDFTVFADEPALDFDRSLIFGAKPTRRILADASTDSVRLRAVVRAHQHSPERNPLMSRLIASDGAFRHWQENETAADAVKSVDALRRHLGPEESRPIPDGSVWTFNVSPDSIYGFACQYDFVTVGMLRLAPAFKDWRMGVLKIPVF